MKWVSGNKTYSIQFSSFNTTDDDYQVSFTLIFSGTVTIGNELTTFSGTQYTPRDPYKFYTLAVADITALVGEFFPLQFLRCW